MWCLFRKHTCKHVEKKNVATRWPTKHLESVIHTLASMKRSGSCNCCIFPWHAFKKPKNYKGCMKGWVAHSPAPCRWIRMKGCLNYVHILGCYSVWFLCLSSAEKRSWGKKKFSEVCINWFTCLSYKLSHFTIIVWWFIPKLHQQTIKN